MALFDYNVEPTLEAALVSLLTAQNITAGGSLTTNALSTPRVDVRFELGAERDIQTQAPGGVSVSTTWDGQFVLSIITDRDNNNASHSSFRATVRGVMAETTTTAWETALGSRYRLLSLNHLSTAYDVLDADKGLDASILNYAATVRLLQG
jgi:hypothetical protein